MAYDEGMRKVRVIIRMSDGQEYKGDQDYHKIEAQDKGYLLKLICNKIKKEANKCNVLYFVDNTLGMIALPVCNITKIDVEIL